MNISGITMTVNAKLYMDKDPYSETKSI
jgi:hypothetical protein